MKRHTQIAAISILALLLPLAACSGQEPEAAALPTVAITGASVVTQEGDATPYITLTLTTSASDRLLSAQVDPANVAEGVILTAPSQVPTPDPEAKPAPLTPSDPIDSIELPAGQGTSIGPGSYGMWLSGPKKLKAGSTVSITLTLEEAGDIQVQAPVQS